MLRIAILGAGLFVKEQHLPAVLNNPDIELKAIYSRSQKSVDELIKAEKLTNVDSYWDGGAASAAENGSTKTGYEQLLERKDIDAVIVALPITIVPRIIEQALLAGKHVLSEKPIAKDLASAEEIIRFHREKAPHLIYAVAENFRYMESFKRGRQLVEEFGAPTTFYVQSYKFMDQTNKWYLTPWRTVPEYQGGFILDGGVHFIAGLRRALGEENPIVKVSAFSSLNRPYLPPVDTINSVALLKNGTSGTFCISFGTSKNVFDINVQCADGYVSLTQDTVRYKRLTDKEETVEYFKDNGGIEAVPREVNAFAQAVKSGIADPNQSPEHAYLDLAFVEKILSSAQNGGQLLDVPVSV